MQEIIYRAKINNQKKTSLITINHLSPNRNLRNLRENEDLKIIDAQTKFLDIEQNLKESIVGAENDVICIDKMTDEDAFKIL